MIQLEDIANVLDGVVHPEIEKSVIELNLVQNLSYQPNEETSEAGTIKFRLVFHTDDPMAEQLKENCRAALKRAFPKAESKVVVLIDKQKATGHKKNEVGRGELGATELAEVKQIIAVASGKGGVGKSTVAVNLAVTLARQGYKVGLLDADVYGPSVPKMTATEGLVPEMAQLPPSEKYPEGKNLIVPIEKYGVKWISIGYFVTPEQALIWRGPMACGALKQLALEVMWGELDYLLIDLPPGTGDIHITMIQDIPVTGAIIVTTPQQIALADVEKGINMFQNQDVNKPILGVVENMSWFTPAELPDNKYYIFGKEGGKKTAEKYNLPLLAQIPIVMSVMEGGDDGRPVCINPKAEGGKIVAEAFEQLASKIG